jgi:hypothetical protein
MDMKDLLNKMRILEADGEEDITPDFKSQQMPGSAPSLSQTTNKVSNDETNAPEKPTMGQSDEVTKNNLVTRLYNLLTQLTKAKTPATESFKSSIAKAIMESYIVEAELSNTGQINKIIGDIDGVIQQLQPYKNDPSVIKAFQQADKIKKANYALTPAYQGGFTTEKFKRFQELMAKAGKTVPTTAPKPTTSAPVAKPTTSSTDDVNSNAYLDKSADYLG